MGFLDNLSKTLSTGTDRVKFEAEKFQRTTKISGEITNLKAQLDTNLRQLGERTLELYQQGVVTAPEVASLAQIMTQLGAQLAAKEHELDEAQKASFEPAPEVVPSTSQQVPITAEPAALPPTPHSVSAPSSVSVPPVAGGATPYACASCGYSLPQSSAFCPNCGARVATS